MKRTLSLGLASILVFCLAGCGQFRQFQLDERNKAAKEYKGLKLFNQDSNALANLPEPKTEPKTEPKPE